MRLLVALWIGWFALPATAAAHVLDQYLQVTQVALAPDGVRVELRLVPGVEVAERVFAVIDADHDGKISPAEEQGYARRVLQDLALELDQRGVALALTSAQFPSRREMTEGVGVIRFEPAAQATLAAGEHRLAFRNDHLPALAGYLANVLAPTTDAIQVTGQRHDRLQHELQVEFRVRPSDGRGRFRWLALLLLGV